MYKDSRKQFRKLCEDKETEYNKSVIDKLMDEGKDPRNMWKCMKRITKDSDRTGNISPTEWFEYFETLTNGNKAPIDEKFKQEVN